MAKVREQPLEGGLERRPGLHATPLGLAAVAVPVIGWSFANTIVKLTPVPVIEFTFFRLWIGTLCMLIVSAVARRRLDLADREGLGAGGGAVRGEPDPVLRGLSAIWAWPTCC